MSASDHNMSDILSNFPYLKHNFASSKTGSSETDASADSLTLAQIIHQARVNSPTLPVTTSSTPIIQSVQSAESLLQRDHQYSLGNSGQQLSDSKNGDGSLMADQHTLSIPVQKCNTQSEIKHVTVASKSHQDKKIKFYLRGKLGPGVGKTVKLIKETLIVPVDCEEIFSDNYVYNYPRPIKMDQELDEVEKDICGHDDDDDERNWSQSGSIIKDASRVAVISQPFVNSSIEQASNSSNESSVKVENLSNDEPLASTPLKPESIESRYMEPSLAEIRARVLGIEDRRIVEMDDEDDSKETIDDDYAENANEESVENISNDSETDPLLHTDENWYRMSGKKYCDQTPMMENTDLTPSHIKGGRSDPDNPFAITSPSFSDSAAKALLTTVHSSNATIVTISVMSIGSRDQLIPKITNSKAAEGGIISIANDRKTVTPTESVGQVQESQKTSIMSKLKQSTSISESKDESMSNKIDSKIDRLDINIRIEDEQYVGYGENKRWQCKLCDKSYTTKHNLVTHILDHTGIKPHLCLVCGKYFKQLSHLNVHMLTHDKVRPHVCSVCNRGFTQVSHLKRHETVHTGSKPYICDMCNRGFAFPSELRAHKDKHFMTPTEKCCECDAEFQTQSELQAHMTNENHGRDLTCKQCNRVFRFPSLLRDHIKSHDGVRPYICTECGMDFIKEHHLKSHLFTHTGIRPYACSECGRSFNQKANMNRHMLIHKSDRDYRCEVCSKTFTQQQTLKAHMVVHSADKPYKCKICPKKFSRQHNLQGHMHVHNNSRPFMCSICQSSFTLRGNLNRHKKIKHGLDETTENMEVDAVKFLSTISDRMHVTYASETESDLEDNVTFTRSKKKSRKSVPKRLGKKNDKESINRESGSDLDTDNVVGYSDDERENVRMLRLQNDENSKYFRKDESKNLGKIKARERVSDNLNEMESRAEVSEDESKHSAQHSAPSVAADGSNRRSSRKRKRKEYDDSVTESRNVKCKLDNVIGTRLKN